MQNRIKQLFIKQLKGTITPQESLELDNFKASSPESGEMLENLSSDPQHLLKMVRLSRELSVDAAWRRANGDDSTKIKSRWRIIAAAAVVLIILGIGWLFWDKKPDEKAVVDNRRSDSPEMITLATGKGESTKLQLPDGSSIWLNSASAVQYPVSFSGHERAVRLLEGEVHCEIYKDTSRPFKMQIRGMYIEVKGTKFDISAYKEDGLVRTTLIEGNVTLKAGNDSMTLRTGEQAIWAPGKKMKKISVDSVEARARSQGWKENNFKWINADVRTVLYDIAHWYGYKLIYKTEVSADPYNVTILRSQTLNYVLARIKDYNRIKIEVDSTTITVSR